MKKMEQLKKLKALLDKLAAKHPDISEDAANAQEIIDAMLLAYEIAEGEAS